MRLGEDLALGYAGRVPLYVQIARYLRKRLVAGRYRTLDQLSGSRLVAAELGCHYNTVLKAYRLLRAEGLLSTRERVRARIQNQPMPWLIDAMKLSAKFEIKACMRELLAYGMPIDKLNAFMAITQKQVFAAARASPERRFRKIMAKYQR